MKEYIEGYELKDGEYLLKIRDDSTGFMTKLNKNGTIPKDFKSFGIPYGCKEELPIYVIEETYMFGWKLVSWRFGMSMNWAKLMHPLGFTVEIYLQNFLNIVNENTIINGVIQGNFKWVYSNLIKE